MSGSSVLAGFRVVELANERTAYAGKLLADMGADVILVEPPGGDRTRHYEPFVDDVPDPEKSLFFWHYQTSKRGITLDLDHPSGLAVFVRLAVEADLLLEGEPPGRMKALGISARELCEEHAGLLAASITPFGQHGPRVDEQATDLTTLAGGGPVWSCGYDDHSLPPVRGAGGQAAQIAGHYAVMSILTAHLHRLATGEGQHIDVNMHAAANVTTEMASYHWLIQEGTVKRQTGRHAMEDPTLPTQVECADGRHITSGVPPRTPREFGHLHAWIVELGLEDAFPEAVFLKLGSERESIDLSTIGQDDEVTAIFGAGREALNFIATRVSAYDFFRGAQERGMAAGVVYAPEEAFEDEHFQARGFPHPVEHPVLGRTITYPGAPYKFEKTPWAIQRPAPQLGEHTEQVLRQAGLAENEISTLRETGALG